MNLVVLNFYSALHLLSLCHPPLSHDSAQKDSKTRHCPALANLSCIHYKVFPSTPEPAKVSKQVFVLELLRSWGWRAAGGEWGRRPELKHFSLCLSALFYPIRKNEITQKGFLSFCRNFRKYCQVFLSKQQHHLVQKVSNTISNWMTLIRKDQKVDLESCEFEFNLAQTLVLVFRLWPELWMCRVWLRPSPEMGGCKL